MRLEVAGPRGKASFAKQLGISASTYDYYESARVPPADILVKVADIGGVDLRWLLTGRAGENASVAVCSNHPAVQRVAKLLGDHPDAAEPLAAFLDILAASMKFPAKVALAGGEAAGEFAESTDISTDRSTWIPVLGRTAAGVPQFWQSQADADAVTQLSELVARNAQRSSSVLRAVADSEVGGQSETVGLVTLNVPDENDVSEFIAAAGIKSRFPDVFAVRVDGESMMPDIRHGDLVMLSPSAPAVDGRVAVVQLDGQIGVTCKVFRRSGEAIHLIPVNEQYPPQNFPSKKLVWALRVLGRVRVATGK